MNSVARTRTFLRRTVVAAALLAFGALAAGCGIAYTSEPAVVVPVPAVDEAASTATSEKAVLAGGCFWGVQGVFQHVKGVRNAISGYAGGAAATAHYEDVGLGNTGHAESVEVVFDPRQITYGEILQIYFSVAHDPTELNRQGPDSGTQYRSTIFPLDEAQKNVASHYIAQLDASGVFARPIATTIQPGASFFPAEAYHQDFLANNPTYPYIRINDLPKIENLKRLFPDRYRDAPTLTSVVVH
jgi:peptide-methionine (S)-S-oxide reductase